VSVFVRNNTIKTSFPLPLKLDTIRIVSVLLKNCLGYTVTFRDCNVVLLTPVTFQKTLVSWIARLMLEVVLVDLCWNVDGCATLTS
jgi:hypothetical protein